MTDSSGSADPDIREDATRPVAVISGATGAIGGAIARDLATTHAVWIVGRNRERLVRRASEVAGAETWLLDFAKIHEDITLPQALVRVDVLVLAAGLWSGDTIANTTVADWYEIFAVNLFGQAALTGALLPLLRSSQGRVVVLGSTATKGSPATRAAYTASKAALDVFGRALHEEERDNGVQVIEIIPGRVASLTQEKIRAAEGGSFDPADYLAPEVIAMIVRQAIDMAPAAHLESVVVRPVYRPPR